MAMVHCRECGKKISDSAKACPHCGARVKHTKADVKEVNWIVCLVVSFFVGFLGVDRFMMGHVGLGLLKLFTLGGFFIWALIDFILIAMKHDFKGVEWV